MKSLDSLGAMLQCGRGCMLAGARVPEAGPLIGLTQGFVVAHESTSSTTLLRSDDGLAVRHGGEEPKEQYTVVRNAWLRGGRPRQTVLCSSASSDPGGSEGPLTTRPPPVCGQANELSAPGLRGSAVEGQLGTAR